MTSDDEETIVNTAKAGELLGMKMIYLEAGSGATNSVGQSIVKNVRDAINVPLIVGGGIKDKNQLRMAYESGADMVVIGTALELDPNFLNQI